MPKLVIVLPGEPPRVIPLAGPSTTIGREPENEVQLDLPDVSRRHCRVEALPQGGHRLLDLGSKNGTFLNGRQVQAMALEYEDRIRVGEATIHFVDDDADPAQVASASGDDGAFPWSAGALPSPAGRQGQSEDTDDTWRTPRGDAARGDRGRGDRGATGPHTRRSNRSYLKERLLRLGLLSQNIASEQDLSRLMDTILDEVIDFTGFERGLLLLGDEDETGRLKVVRGRTMERGDLDEAERRYSRGLVDDALGQRRITFRSNIASDRAFSARDSVASMGLESALCIPLIVTPMRTVHDANEDRRRTRRRSRVLGVLYLDSTSPIRDLDDPDLRLLEAVAAQAAIALQNARLHHQATTDPLTGLANRGFIKQVFEEELRRARDAREPLAFLILDLDHFKRINDTWGHGVGDEVLRRASGRFRRALRRDDYLGRWGGEEFVVILPGEDTDGALIVAQKIADALRSRPISEAEVRVTASIGVAVYPEHGDTPGQLIKRADQALYAAKAAGRDRTLVFRPEHDKTNHRTSPLAGLLDGDASRLQRNLEAVFDTIDVLRSARPPREILARALDNVCDLTRARRALIVVERGEAGLEVLAGRGAGGRTLEADQAGDFSQSAVRTALAEGRSLCMLDSSDPDARRFTSTSIDKLGLSTIMCVPLIVGDRTLGALYADDHTAHREFTQADLAHLEVMANQLALSLAANSRLYALVSGSREWEETKSLKDEVARLRAELGRLRGADGEPAP